MDFPGSEEESINATHHKTGKNAHLYMRDKKNTGHGVQM